MLKAISKNIFKSGDGEINLMVVLVAFLGFGVFLFGTLAIVAFSSSQRANKILQDSNKEAYDKGRQAQQVADKAQSQKEAESPFRSYVAPTIYGGFEIRFPKNWNAYLVENESGSTQINLTLHPDFVTVVSGRETAYAAHVLLVRQLYAAALKPYEELIKKNKVVSKPIRVSGINSTWLEGKLDNKHDTIQVVVPVRDKVMIFSTDDKNFLDEFKQILAQAQISP